MVGSGSALTYHLTDRIETGRPFVKLVQLAKEEEEEDGKKNLSLPSKLLRKMKDREREIDEEISPTPKIGVTETEVEKICMDAGNRTQDEQSPIISSRQITHLV